MKCGELINNNHEQKYSAIIESSQLSQGLQSNKNEDLLTVATAAWVIWITSTTATMFPSATHFEIKHAHERQEGSRIKIINMNFILHRFTFINNRKM